MIPDMKDLTKQGYDLQFGTNVLGQSYPTRYRGNSQVVCQVIFISLPYFSLFYRRRSNHLHPGQCESLQLPRLGHFLFPRGDIDYETLRRERARDSMGNQTLYLQSKLGNTLVARELARRYASEGIISISLNPGEFVEYTVFYGLAHFNISYAGNIESDLQRTTPKPLLLFLVISIFFLSRSKHSHSFLAFHSASSCFTRHLLAL